MDPTTLTLIVGAALATVPGVLGFALGRRSGRRAAAQRPKLRCSCRHGFGFHEDGQRCRAVNREYRSGGEALEPCQCRHYDGPEPLPRAWTPPTLPSTQD